MPTADYGLGQLSMAQLRYLTTTKNEEIRFVVWGGYLRVNVTKKGELRPIVEIRFDIEKWKVLCDRLERILKASPGTRLPMIFSVWDNNEKKRKPAYSLTFVKDDKNVYRVELKYQGTTYEAIIRGPYGIAFGSENMSDAERSDFGVKALIEYLYRDVVMQRILTNKKMERIPGNGGGSPTAPTSSSGTSDEDFF